MAESMTLDHKASSFTVELECLRSLSHSSEWGSGLRLFDPTVNGTFKEKTS